MRTPTCANRGIIQIGTMLKKLFNLLLSILRGLGMGWLRLRCAVSNLRRRLLRRRLPDYVLFTLAGELNERAPISPWWYAYLPNRRPPPNLEELSDALREIADDPDVKGIVFLLKDFALTLAQAQSFGALLARFRTWDAQCHPGQVPKRVVVHLEQVSSAGYVLACAADEILLTPLTEWNVLGLSVAPTYLKDTLAHLGIEMDVVKIAPWKTAVDQLSRSEMSDEERAQYNWLLDSLYDDTVNAIANGRKLPAALVRELIDGAPWGAEQAIGYGLADGVYYEDELPTHLGINAAQPASLKPYTKIYKLLYRRPRQRAPQSIGVITLSGAIMPGNSRSFPVPLPILGDETMGSSSAQQLIRAAQADDSLAAVILHVDSPGGSALASDLIWRELTLLNQTKPLVVYMGNVAASGGYYIAAPGRKIVAQRATLTGSIGVITSKAVLKESYAKIAAHRESIQRGEHADLYDDGSHWDEDSRAKVVESVQQVYQTFKQRVAAGRGLPYNELDAICNGRVWTGAQALEHKLIDALGDFHCAVELTCALADLPNDGSVATITVTAPKEHLLAEPLQAARALLGLDVAQQVSQLARALLTNEWTALFSREHCWLIAPTLPKIK